MSRHPWRHWSQRNRDEQAAGVIRVQDVYITAPPEARPARSVARSRPKRPKPIPNPEADYVLKLCREGRLFELARLIAEGRGVEMPTDYKQSPLNIAIKSGFHSMVELLLQHESSQARKDEVIATAVWLDQLPIVELALQHGASATSVPLLDALLLPKAELAILLLEHGADPITDYPFPRAFQAGSHSALRAFLDCRQKRPDLAAQLQLHLDMSLRQACSDGRGRLTGLLAWAGGDPRARGLATDDVINTHSEHITEADLETTAVETACIMGSLPMLRSFRVSANRDDLSELLRAASYSPKPEITRWLLRQGANPNDKDNGGSTALDRMMQAVDRPDTYSFWGSRRKLGPEQNTKAFATFKALTESGALWRPDDDNIKRARRALLQLTPEGAMQYLRNLKNQTVCDQATYVELTRTSAMQTLFRLFDREGRHESWRRAGKSTRPVAGAKGEPTSATTTQTQAERQRIAALEKYRQQLFEEVWSLPTQKVATQHGVSDVAIAKTCKRLEIPKPPRGYWAKKAAGLAVPERPILRPLDRESRF